MIYRYMVRFLWGFILASGIFSHVDGVENHESGSSSKDTTVLSEEASAELVELTPMVVTATREKQKRTEVPAAISQVSDRQLKEAKAIRFDQVLNQETGVYMVNFSNESHAMSIRTPLTDGPRFLYLQDGLPIRPTGTYKHTALKEMNLTVAKTVEIQRGPNSSIQGSEAIGGSVNLITKDPPSTPSARLSVQRNDIGYNRLDLEAGTTKGAFGIYGGGYFMMNRDGWRDYSDFDKYIFTVKPVYWLGDKTRLSATVDVMDFYTDFNGGLDSAGFWGKKYTTQQTFTYSTTQLLRGMGRAEHFWNSNSKSTLSLQYYDGSEKYLPFWALPSHPTDPLKASGKINDGELTRMAVVLQHHQKFGFFNSQLFGGISGDFSNLDQETKWVDVTKSASGKFLSFSDPDSLLEDYLVDYINTAAYFNYMVSPVKPLTLSAALRYDYFSYEYSSPEELSILTGRNRKFDEWHHIAPKLGATYDFSEATGAYMNYSQGFIPPQTGAIYSYNGRSDLKPELYDSYEIGGWQKLPDNLGSVEMSLYYMMGTDEIIDYQESQGNYTNRNAGETLHRGIEFSALVTPVEEVELRLNGSYSQHEYEKFDLGGGTDYNGKIMPKSPPLLANAGLTYRPVYLKGLRIGLEFQHLSPYWMDPANSTEYEGFNLVHLRLGYKLKGLELWMNAMNIGDINYAEQASAYAWGHDYRPGDPRHFQIGMSYGFGAL